MSKTDEIRALREANAARRSSKPYPINEPEHNQRHAENAIKRVAPDMAPAIKMAQSVPWRKRRLELEKQARLTPHPDCPVCNARREKTKALMRKKRGAK